MSGVYAHTHGVTNNFTEMPTTLETFPGVLQRAGYATAYVGSSLRYLSDQTGEFDFAFRTTNGRQREIASYEVLDLRTGLLFGRYSIELYAKNVTDSDGRTSTGTLDTYPNGALGTGVIRPRTVGLSFGFGM